MDTSQTILLFEKKEIFLKTKSDHYLLQEIMIFICEPLKFRYFCFWHIILEGVSNTFINVSYNYESNNQINIWTLS